MIRKSILLAAALAAVASMLIVPAQAQGTAASKATSNSAPINRPVRVPGTIVDVAVGNPNFTTLVTALGAASLVTTLQGKGPFTVFAPTNDAFAKVDPAVLNYLLANPTELTKVLLYHVAPGANDLRFAFLTRDIGTVQGQEVFAERERDTLFVNNARVLGQAIVTDNGIIYVIDSVLLPQYR